MKRSTALFALGAVAAVLFLALATTVQTGGVVRIDTALRAEAQRLASPLLTVLASKVTWLGSLGMLAGFGAIAVGLLIRAHRRVDALLLLVTMTGALVFENGLKFLIQRPRPTPFFGINPPSYSFPSGHALFSLCFYGMLAILLGRAMHSGTAKVSLWTSACLLVLAIGATRIYLGVHYPSDVFAGYLVAIALVAIILAAEQRLLSKKPSNYPPAKL